MVFSSLVFLYLFLPLTLLLYYAAPRRLRNPVLLVMSLLFYGWGEPRGVVIMLITCIVNFACAKTIYQHPDSPRLRKAALIVSVVVSLGILGYFKYAGFAAENLPFIAGLGLPAVALPIGISFYTFQAMSCTIDVYRGKVDAAPGFIGYTTYVTLFPQLIAGPIVRYQQIADQLIHRRESADRFAAGVGTFVCGLCKKVLLANQFGALFDQVQAMEDPSALSALFGLLCYTMQIYFDFSGYSDMAIGLGRFFGFELPINFNYPYISRSITEFWRRWHISLGMWFREYVYIPLGGNRGGTVRMLRNIFIVWCLTGLWHGASWNFVLWGLYYGILLLLEKVVWRQWLAGVFEARGIRLPGWLAHVYTMMLVVLGWALFSFTDLAALGGFLAALFGANGLCDSWVLYQAATCLPLLVAGVIGCTPLPKKIWNRLVGAAGNNTDPAQATANSADGLQISGNNNAAPQTTGRGAWLIPVAVIAGLLICTAFLVNASYNPFLYFRF